MTSTDLKYLARQVVEGQVIAFIGAGVSAEYHDPVTGRVTRGLPTATKIVEALSARKPHLIEPSMRFEEATFLFKKDAGERELVNVLKLLLDSRNLDPLPAHRLLAALPFFAYVSLNIDCLLEEAFREMRKPFRMVISDKDVVLTSESLAQATLLKPHGCLSRPDSLVISADQLMPYSQRTPLLDSYLRVLLANKTALFCGFGLKDADFHVLYQSLTQSLDALPRGVAVTLDASEFTKAYWNQQHISIVNEDLTSFLHMLLGAVEEITEDPIQSITSNLPASATRIRTLPSETQVVEAFLDEAQRQLTQIGGGVAPAAAVTEKMAKEVLAARPNFRAFTVVADRVEHILSSSNACEDVEFELMQFRVSRDAIRRAIESKAPQVVSRNDHILLYSQSIRVCQLLAAVPRGIQRTCKLSILECRPKSKQPFRDSYSYLRLLADTEYAFEICPDMAAWSLCSRGELTKIVLGAHDLFVDDRGLPVGFTNTAGSGVLTLISKEFSIPLYVLAESQKCSQGKFDADQVSILEEVSLGPPIVWDGMASAKRTPEFQVLNIGYDACAWHEHMIWISEHQQ